MTDETPHPLADLKPTDPLMLDSWFSFIHFAIDSDEMYHQFQADTGITLQRVGVAEYGRTVDGVDVDNPASIEFLRSYITWLNVNYWGDLDLAAG